MNEVITILSAIKNYCENRGIGDCDNCPFCMDHGWALDCMFCGPHIGEGVIPENWDLEALNYDKINEEVNVYEFVKEHMSSTYGSLTDIDS